MRKIGALTTVVVLAFTTSSAAAFAQDDTSTLPVPTGTTTTPTTTSLEPAPPQSSESPPPAPPQQPRIQQENSVSGFLYGDKDGNGKQDPGEAVQGEVTLFGGATASKFRATSDAEGEFAFQDLPPGLYHATYELRDGWVVHLPKTGGDEVTVVSGTTAALTVRAERPYSEQIKATASFDRDSYEYPSSAKITLDLTNTTDRGIDGVVAECNRANVGHALGYSPDWHVLQTRGQTLEPGQKRTFTFEERIPLGALAAGTVTLDCDFAPNAFRNTDGPRVHAEAVVTGGFGYTMILGEDRNADQHIDANEAVKGAKVALLNQATGKQVAERVSGPDGKVEFTGLKIGDYQAVLLGSWAFTDDSQQLVRVTEAGGTEQKFLKYASPAVLRSSMKLDKPRYESHETVRVDVTVTNVGGQAAERVRLFSRFWDVLLTDDTWGGAGEEGPGVRIPAGESRTFSATGNINNISTGDIITLTAWVEYVGMPNNGPIGFSANAGVVQTFGDITGVLYVDRNHNGQQDSGEAAANSVVETSGGVPFGYFKTTTDADGRYSFNKIPSGHHTVDYALDGGWVVHRTRETASFRVVPGTALQITARADRPYNEALSATMVLDKAIYEIGAEAEVTVTLQNKAGYTVSGIQAWCNSGEKGNELGSRPMTDSWGDLRETGVTLGPGETKTIVVTEKVPEGARTENRVTVRCYFAPWAELNYYYAATAYDWAGVPGESGSLRGPVVHDRNHNRWVDDGETVPNTRVRLMTDREFGGIVAEAVSDAKGNVLFDQVPPGEYWAEIDGPWKFEGDQSRHVWVVTGRDTLNIFYVVPGPTPPGDDRGQEGRHTGGGKALARTGASVLGLGVLAALLVAFGLGARVVGRRKTS